jgi:hypothetical protein
MRIASGINTTREEIEVRRHHVWLGNEHHAEVLALVATLPAEYILKERPLYVDGVEMGDGVWGHGGVAA